ncbi:AAA family ATPase [Oscillospiraceae bacterium WX1]
MDAIELIPKLIRSSYEGDKKTIEATSIMIARKIKKDYPEVAGEISKILAYSKFDNAAARSLDLQPLPVDRETRYSLVNLDEPSEMPAPILDDFVMKQLDDFIIEREMLDKFLEEDIIPPNSLLLSGPPGVGKTYIAHWISWRLNLPLITLDLATSISSYLGRSGQNIRSIFDYAKSQNSILFLDELDAIAKKRDDTADLGELKRLVNVLLKELESCPSSCIIIAATNHPELLDKAIWRRFDRTLSINMPDEHERKQLFLRHLGNKLDEESINYLSRYSSGVNAADICKLCEHIKRQSLLNPQLPKNQVALSELFKVTSLSSREDKVRLCKYLNKSFSDLSQRDIAQITQIPLASVSRYLKESRENIDA